MASKPFTINGLDSLKKQLNELLPTMAEEIDLEIDASADAIVNTAKRLAPKDLGNLAAGISKKKTVFLEREIVSAASWSVFQEFGTRSKVQIPAGYEDFASQYRGQKGEGTLDEFFANILEWVKRNGISGTYSVKTQRRTGSKAQRSDEDRQTAYAIMLSILRNGINPHPFFIPAIEGEKPKLLQRIKNIVTSPR